MLIIKDDLVSVFNKVNKYFTLGYKLRIHKDG